MAKHQTELVGKLFETYHSVVTMVFWRSVELIAMAKYLHYLKGDIVDIGCGDGTIASLVFEKETISVGYDIEERPVKAASRRGYRAVVVADARYTPFRDACFDGLFSNSAIEHFPEIDKCCSEFFRISKAGSFFVFTVISGSFYDSFWCSGIRFGELGKKWMERHRRLRQHLNVWDVDKWKAFLEKHGFELVDHKHYINPRAMFWWSLAEDAHTWPFGIGSLVPIVINVLIPKRILRDLALRLLSEDEGLCNGTDKGAGLLLVAQKKF